MSRAQPRQIADPSTREPLPWWTRAGEPWPDGHGGLPVVSRVLGQTYRVLLHTDVYNDAAGRVPLLGGCSPMHRVIVIDPQRPLAEIYRTLAHERGHVYAYERPALANLKPAQLEAVCDLVADVLEDLGILRG